MFINLTWKKIPKPAIICYLKGLLIIGVCLLLWLYWPQLLPMVRVQQGFIGGAIIVAIGSVINTLYQFRPGKKDSKDAQRH